MYACQTVVRPSSFAAGAASRRQDLGNVDAMVQRERVGLTAGCWGARVCVKARSISLLGLAMLLQLLCGLPWFVSRGLAEDSISSNDVRSYLLEGLPHPAKLFPHCFSSAMPVVALTYEWRLGLKGVLSFFALAQLSECNREYNRGLPTDHTDLLIWIDVLFIDQLSKNVGELLVQSQRVYEFARFHVALATLTLLSRAWCLFELGVRHNVGKETLFLTSPLFPIEDLFQQLAREIASGTFGRFFERMEAFEEGDTLLIRNKIIEVHHTPQDFDRKLCLSIIAVTSKNAPASTLPALPTTSGATQGDQEALRMRAERAEEAARQAEAAAGKVQAEAQAATALALAEARAVKAEAEANLAKAAKAQAEAEGWVAKAEAEVLRARMEGGQRQAACSGCSIA